MIPAARVPTRHRWTAALLGALVASAAAVGAVGATSAANAAPPDTIVLDGAAKNVSVKTPGELVTFTFSGTDGSGVSALLTESTFGGCPGGVRVALLRPDLSVRAAVKSCTDTAFLDQTLLDQTGTWRLRVTGQSGATGDASLRAFDASDQVKTIKPNQNAVHVNLVRPGQNAALPFTGTSGQEVTVDIADATFTGCPAFAVALVRPDGTRLGNPMTSCTDVLSFGPVTLDQDGTWTLLVDPQGITTGTATARLFSGSEEVRPITLNGAPENLSLGAGQKAKLQFDGTTGQQVSAQSTVSTFPGCPAYTLALVRPDGSQLGASVDGCDDTAFLDSARLDVDGKWAFVVTPQQAGTMKVQAFTFVDQNSAAADMEGKNNKLVFVKPGQNARTTFSATAGDHVSAYAFRSTLTACPAFTVTLMRPDHSVLAGPLSTCTDNAFLDEVALDATGKYTVLVDPQGPATGTVFLQLYALTDVSTTIKPGKAIKSFTTTARGTNARFRFTGAVGDSRTVTISGSTFGGCPGLAVSFVRPDGTTLATQTTCNRDLVLGPSVLDADGTWTVFVDPQGPANGTLIIKLT